MTAEYPTAQHFRAPPRCRKCGKPAGEVMSHRNEVVAYMCETHARAAIKASHKKHGQFMPDAVIDGRC